MDKKSLIMQTLAKLKTIFRLRAVLAILAFLCLCIPHLFYTILGLTFLIVLWMIDDFRHYFWKHIKAEADIDYPE